MVKKRAKKKKPIKTCVVVLRLYEYNMLADV
jgi:hypothetical protein